VHVLLTYALDGPVPQKLEASDEYHCPGWLAESFVRVLDV
jgi:hypothetical protein